MILTRRYFGPGLASEDVHYFHRMDDHGCVPDKITSSIVIGMAIVGRSLPSIKAVLFFPRSNLRKILVKKKFKKHFKQFVNQFVTLIWAKHWLTCISKY